MLKLFGSPRKSTASSNKSLVEVVDHNQECNPYTEVQIFSHHSNIIRHLVLLGDNRFASAGDDSRIVIGNLNDGRRLHVLEGHSRPITCLHLVGPTETRPPLLVSAASDKIINMWDVDSGEVFRRLQEHHSTARCFLMLEDKPYFCSGGDKLCLWQLNGTMETQLDRGEEEDVTQMICLLDDRIIASVDKRLEVYSFRENSQKKVEIFLNRKLAPHREAIKTLLKINEACFASGSLDGAIVLWSSQALAPSRYFNSVRDYLGDDRVYPHSIQAFLCLEERYLVCAVGTGFRVYDIISGRVVMEKLNAHHSKILCVCLVHGGFLLVSSSEDGSVRLWGSLKSFCTEPSETASTLERLLGVSKNDMRLLREKEEKIEPHLIGECLGHTGSVQVCLDAQTEGMLTCGADGLVIAWKDGVREEMKRMATLNTLLKDLNETL